MNSSQRCADIKKRASVGQRGDVRGVPLLVLTQ